MSSYKFRQAAKKRKFTAFFISTLLLGTLAALLIYQDGTNVFEFIAELLADEPAPKKPSIKYP